MLSNTGGKRIKVSDADFTLFEKELHNGAKLDAEHMEGDLHLDEMIRKPWGHEYRIYADQFYDIWKLSINPGQSTSLHCHPRKETVLVVLRGTCEISFLNHSRTLTALDYVYIDKGVFHSTTNVGNEDLMLIEIETPRNKLDLVRAQDVYGRARTKYERESIDGDVPKIELAKPKPGSKIRPGDCSGIFQFQIISGRDLVAAKSVTTACVVDLGVRHVINQDIRVLLYEQIDTYTYHDDHLYFNIISRESIAQSEKTTNVDKSFTANRRVNTERRRNTTDRRSEDKASLYTAT